MAGQEDVEREAASLREELYLAADSGLYPDEQGILFDLNHSVAAAVRAFGAAGGSGAQANDEALAACTAARRSLDALDTSGDAGLQDLVRKVSAAVDALEGTG
ncbi:MAG: hypothetical protein ACXWU1_07225 [Allosphingosinicella sp.]